MTKKELIKLLKKFPDDTLVIVNGHSDGQGYNSVSMVEEINVSPNKDWEGEYAIFTPSELNKTKAILISDRE